MESENRLLEALLPQHSAKASRFLEYDFTQNKEKTMHTLTGYVEHGDARAREFGFPTANIALEGEDSLDGVWVGYVRFPNGYTYFSVVV